MKILKLIIKNYQQFKHLELDFTHPVTAAPLDKICFIGRNATGKSTILSIINEFIKDYQFAKQKNVGTFIFKIQTDNRTFYYAISQNIICLLDNEIDKITDWAELLFKDNILTEIIDKNSSKYQHLSKYILWNTNESIDKLLLKNNSTDLLVYCPADSKENKYMLDDVPETNLINALQLTNKRPYFHVVSEDTVNDFWNLLMYNIQSRKEEFDKFAENNSSKSYGDIKREFNDKNPEILESLSKIWNLILKNVDLYFDFKNVNIPKMSTDKLKAYIKHKNQNVIPYAKLSTGIRNFIFKIGHIYSLYLDKNIKHGFLLVDEPENSLFPDFLYDLIDNVYCKIIENKSTQFFVATHNPIIAAQFEPYERIILDFDDSGSVAAKKGRVPIGDDPNDILYKDFGMRSIYTKKGLEKWERFLELKTIIDHTSNEKEKEILIEEFSKLGREYNFPIK